MDSEEHLRSIEVAGAIQVRNLAKREIDVRLVPWGVTVETLNGPEVIERGAFADARPEDVFLMGLEHEVHIGLGQNGAPTMTRHPVGRAIALDDREDAQYATYRVARTARGDEVLALAEEGIVSGVSVEFLQVPGGSSVQTRAGRRTHVHKRLHLVGASTTYRPTWSEAQVLAVRSKEGAPIVADTPTDTETAAAPPPPTIDYDQMAAAIARGNAPLTEKSDSVISAVQARSAIQDEQMQKLLERLDKMEEQGRAQFTFPAQPEDKAHPDDFHRGDWLKLVLRTLSGETVSQAELQTRVAADLITSDNLGVVPTAYLNEIIGIIDPGRPFLESTRRITTPRSGITLSVPKIITRPTTGVQAEEKDELTSTPSSIVPATFDMTTVGGYGDISIQLLKRSDPSYLEMYVDLLAEAYAIDADDQAVDALIAAGMSQGGAFDPDDGPKFGEAWANAVGVSRLLRPDTIWLSTAAVQQFIDATNPDTGAPLYGNLAANFSAAGGPGGNISGLRPVHVPALDDETADIIVGPSRAFAWAEDGTYTLQVDVPAKAGRDVGLVGMMWFAPLYPAAFTRYWLESA